MRRSSLPTLLGVLPDLLFFVFVPALAPVVPGIAGACAFGSFAANWLEVGNSFGGVGASGDPALESAGSDDRAASLSGPRPRPARRRVFAANLPALRALLSRAPVEASGVQSVILIALPLPDGRLESFRVVASPILGPAAVREHPGLSTYRVVGAADRLLQGRIDLTTNGLRAILFTPQGTALIDPVERGRTDRVMSYWLRDDAIAGSFECLTDFSSWPATASAIERSRASAGDQSRTYRFILVATGEYAQFFGGVAQAEAQMATSMNRIEAVLERDLSVHLQVEHLLTFADPATDPFDQFSVGQLLTRNRQVVDSLYGVGAYDMHQVIHVRSGYRGVSFRPFACDSSFKGQSAVYGEDPTTNLFDIKVMAHEIGHTLGATHSQDGGANRATSPLTTYEISDGWTIMTSPGHPASFGDAYYHVGSLDQMDTVLVNPPEVCAHLVPTGNTPPTVDAGSDYTIPRGTPFLLSGSGSDPDAGDVLTYTWEEFDASSTSYDPVNGPLFRWRIPTLSPTRALPDIATVLSGVPDSLEKLPAVDRLMRFRLTARDNHPGNGGHAWDQMLITVSGAPFAVTFPNGGDTLVSAVPFTVTWQVGGGSVADSVDVLLSTDGGASWQILADDTPNDGSASVTAVVPSTRTACRIKVEAVGNIFYDVSNSNFTIRENSTPVLVALENVDAAPDRVRLVWSGSLPGARARVERRAMGGEWRTLADLIADGQGRVAYEDRDVTPGARLQYRLGVREGGEEVRLGFANVVVPFWSLSLAVATTSDGIRFDFRLPSSDPATLAVFDLAGRKIWSREVGHLGAGGHQDHPRDLRLCSGLYFARLTQAAEVRAARFAVLR
jgi:hypothetical protein